MWFYWILGSSQAADIIKVLFSQHLKLSTAFPKGFSGPGVLQKELISLFFFLLPDLYSCSSALGKQPFSCLTPICALHPGPEPNPGCLTLAENLVCPIFKKLQKGETHMLLEWTQKYWSRWKLRWWGHLWESGEVICVLCLCEAEGTNLSEWEALWQMPVWPASGEGCV